MLSCQQHISLVGFWGPKLTPQLLHKLLKMELKRDPIFGHAFLIFGLRFGSILGGHFGSKAAMMRQDGPKKDLKNPKVPKSSNCKKCDFITGIPYFLSLGLSRRAEEAQDGSQEAPEVLQDSKNQGSQNGIFFLFVGLVLERFWDPKQTPKLT